MEWGIVVTIAVAAIDDGSLAMVGAVETLRESNLCTLIGVYGDLSLLPMTAMPIVLLVDPFGDPVAGLDHLACVPKPYAPLVMCAHTHLSSARSVLRTGARGVITKEVDASTLLDAVSAVGFGGIYLGSQLDGLLLHSAGEEWATSPAAHLAGLTPRERDVLIMVAKGLTHKQIGTRLNLAKATIDTYVHRVRQKVGSGNKADLTRLAMDLGLIEDHLGSPL